MKKIDYGDLTAREVARRLRLAVRGGKSLLSACEERGWPYHGVRTRLLRAGLWDGVMAAKYETTEVSA